MDCGGGPGWRWRPEGAEDGRLGLYYYWDHRGFIRIIGYILGLYRDYIGVMLGLYYPNNGESNGKENGK